MVSPRMLKPILAPTVRRALAARFDRPAIRRILDDTFVNYEAQRDGLPREASAGGRMMVHFAGLTIGLYRALLVQGVTEAEARELTAAVTWRAFRRMATVPTALARMPRGSPRARVKRANDLFRRFPFSRPSYQMVDIASGPNVVAFDVQRCPVAEYFRSQGLGALCQVSWCNLDFQLAREWGIRLERPLTLAGGANRCDFRWQV